MLQCKGSNVIIDRKFIMKVIESYRQEYAIDKKYQNPAKMSLDLKVNPDTGEVNDYCNVMTARTQEGFYGVKTISIAQDGVNSNSSLQLYNCKSTKIAEYDFLDLTRLRCALLVAMDILASRVSYPKVAFIGVGKITLMTFRVLNMILGEENWSATFLERPDSEKDSTTLTELSYEKTLSYSHSYELLLTHKPDFVVTSTSASYSAELMSYEMARDHLPIKFISLDGGYILDYTLRENLPVFTDSIPQMIPTQPYESDEFPHDPPWWSDLKHSIDLRDWSSSLTSLGRPESYVLHLTGMAIFDVLLALEVYREELR